MSNSGGSTDEGVAVDRVFGLPIMQDIQELKVHQAEQRADKHLQYYHDLIKYHDVYLNQVTDYTKINCNLKNEIVQKEEELKEKQAEIRQLKSTMDDQNTMIDGQKKEIQEWKLRAVKLSVLQKTIVNEFKKKMTQDEKKEQIAKDQALEEARQENLQLQEQYKQQKKVCSWLETDQRTQQLELLYLKGQLDENEKVKEQLESELEEKNQAHQQLTVQLKECEEENLQLRSQLQEAQNIKKKAMSNFNEIKNELQEEMDKLADVQRRNGDLSKKVQELVDDGLLKDRQIEKLKEQLTSSQQKAQRLQQQLYQSQQYRQQLESEVGQQNIQEPSNRDQNICQNTENDLQEQEQQQYQQQESFQDQHDKEASEEVQDEREEVHEPADSADLLLSGKEVSSSQKINQAFNNIQTHIIDRIQETPQNEQHQQHQQQMEEDNHLRQLVFDENDTDNDQQGMRLLENHKLSGVRLSENQQLSGVRQQENRKLSGVDQHTPTRKSTRKRSSGREWWRGDSPKKCQDIAPQQQAQLAQNGKRKLDIAEKILKNPKQKKQTRQSKSAKNTSNTIIGQSFQAGVLEMKKTNRRRKTAKAGKVVKEDYQNRGKKVQGKNKQVDHRGNVMAERNPRSQLTSITQRSQIDPLEVIFGYKPIIPKLLSKNK